KSFEKLLLDYSQRADQSKDLLATQLMQSVIQVIQAYEQLVQTLSHLTYVNEAKLDAKQLMGLRNHYRQLAAISQSDLNRMVVQPVVESLYLTYFGKEKLRALLDFLHQEAVTPVRVDHVV